MQFHVVLDPLAPPPARIFTGLYFLLHLTPAQKILESTIVAWGGQYDHVLESLGHVGGLGL